MPRRQTKRRLALAGRRAPAPRIESISRWRARIRSLWANEAANTGISGRATSGGAHVTVPEKKVAPPSLWEETDRQRYHRQRCLLAAIPLQSDASHAEEKEREKESAAQTPLHLGNETILEASKCPKKNFFIQDTKKSFSLAQPLLLGYSLSLLQY